MSKLSVFESLTLDGVMQAPARPDEDTRDGFQHGGWATAYADPVQASLAGEGMSTTGALLLGRRTYEDFATVWPKQTEGPYILLVHPLVLGSGRRLFSDGVIFTTLRLVESKTSRTGVLVATYEPV